MNVLGHRVRWTFAVGLVVMLALLGAAACGDDDDDDDNGGGDDVPTATEDATGGAEEQALQDLLDSAAAAWNAGDVDAFLAHFTNAGVLAAFDAPRQSAILGETPRGRP